MIFLSRLLICIVICGISVPSQLFAATSDFTITTFIGDDAQAPTTPNLLSVVPVAPTQINISWSAATDDVLVAGYRLFRDSIQIATTTLLSYSDTGLLSSTTYSYTVDAFDSFGNISSSSAPVATTTLPNPPIATTTGTSTQGGAEGTRTVPSLLNLDIFTTTQTAQFTWNTRGVSSYTLLWGRTSSYELGSVSSNIYNTNHITTIDALEPGTTYYYELRATNVRGLAAVISKSTFTTKSEIITTQLPNVRDFKAQVKDFSVALSWSNPITNADTYVRIVRSHLFYPGTIQSGAVVYEGTGESFTDTNALLDRSPQYYTVFVLDRQGNVSSGAIARAVKTSVNGQGIPSVPYVPTATSSQVENPEIVLSDIGDDRVLKAADISIVQQSSTHIFDTEISLIQNEPYLISIPKEALANNLKTIIVSVQNPSNQKDISSYLLKLNQVGDAYTAYVAPPNISGDAKMIIEVFDYEQETVRRISTIVTFVPGMQDSLNLESQWGLIALYIGALSILISFLFWFFLIWRRRKKQTS